MKKQLKKLGWTLAATMASALRKWAFDNHQEIDKVINQLHEKADEERES